MIDVKSVVLYIVPIMKERLLIHSCCGPCSAYPFSILLDSFKVEAFYSNSNLNTAGEYFKRLEGLRLLCSRQGVTCHADDYVTEQWKNAVKGYEHEPERGGRCKICYEYRLRRTFEFAKTNNIKYVTTTLTVAPYKDTRFIFEIETNLSSEYGVKFLDFDFKKKNGYAKTKELAKENDLYIQDYCGCEFSLVDKEQRTGGEL